MDLGRRQMLAALAGLGSAGLAGCSSGSGGDTVPSATTTGRATSTNAGGGAGTADPTATATATETATETSTETETATATPTEERVVAAAVRSVEQDAYETEAARYDGIHAHVENTGTVHLFIRATGTFYNSEGNVLDTVPTSLWAFAPGETWEVWVEYFDRESEVAAVDFEIDDTTTVETGIDPVGFSVDESTLDTDTERQHYAYIRGTATNNTDSESHLEAMGKFYAANGNVLTSSRAVVGALDAGATWAFDMRGYFRRAAWADRLDDHAVVLST